jgi:hypothetical protein
LEEMPYQIHPSGERWTMRGVVERGEAPAVVAVDGDEGLDRGADRAVAAGHQGGPGGEDDGNAGGEEAHRRHVADEAGALQPGGEEALVALADGGGADGARAVEGDVVGVGGEEVAVGAAVAAAPGGEEVREQATDGGFGACGVG